MTGWELTYWIVVASLIVDFIKVTLRIVMREYLIWYNDRKRRVQR